mmetsp:Transcript_31553/g.89598  ORF Transcript_31553/g.89598 Transcript_31553/m.89598 type:complete len:1308 (-) Transcript_31553:658-4581(-)
MTEQVPQPVAKRAQPQSQPQASKQAALRQDVLGHSLVCDDRVFIAFLIRRILNPSITQKTERAAWLLLHLSRSTAATSLLLDCGVIGALVDVIQRLPSPWDLHTPRSGSNGDQFRDCNSDSFDWDSAEDTATEANIVEYATGALAQLAHHDYPCRASIAGHGAVEPLIALLAEGPHCVATENAVAILQHLAASTPALRDEIRDSDGIPALVSLLQETPAAHNAGMARSLLWTLICLAEQHPLNQSAIWDAGGCRALATIMGDGCFLNSNITDAAGTRALAARCLYVLAQESPDTQYAVCRTGVVAVVVDLLRSTVPTLSRTAADCEAAWRSNVAAIFGMWSLLQQVHRAVAGPGEVLFPTGEDEAKAEEGSKAKELTELQDIVWTAWREVALELMMRVLPVSGRRLEPSREALRALKALTASCAAGPRYAAEAGVVPVLVDALRMQLDSGKDLADFVAEPADQIAVIASENPAVQEEVRAMGGVELLVKILPSAEGNGTSTSAGGGTDGDLGEADMDDVVRFWWDRIMWDESSPDPAALHGRYPFNVCKVAAAALDSVCTGCEENCRAALAAGVMHRLVQVLHNTVACRRLHAVISTASALAALLDGRPEAQKEFICRRGIAPLMSLLRLPVDSKVVPLPLWLLLQSKAALCVQRLVEDFPAGQRRVRQAGAIPCLLGVVEEALRSSGRLREPQDACSRVTSYVGTMDEEEVEAEALEACLWAINNLVAHNPENQEALRRAMGVPVLVSVLSHTSSEGALSGAVWAIAQLASGGGVAQDELAAVGIVPALMRVGYSHEVADGPLCEGLARAVGALANNHPQMQELLRPAGAMELMVQMLQCGSDTVTAECAAQSLAALCWRHPANQALIGELGGLRLLIQHLMAGPHQLLSRGASLALAAAVGGNINNQEIVRDAGGTFVLVDMLRSGCHNPVVVPALHALGQMVKGHRAAQTEVGEAGGTAALLKLIQDGGMGDATREACASLAALTHDHPTNKSAVQRDGGIPVLLGIVKSGCESLASRGPALPGAWQEKTGHIQKQPWRCEGEAGGGCMTDSPGADIPTQMQVTANATATLVNLITGNASIKADIRDRGAVPLFIQLLGLAASVREHWPQGAVWLNAVTREAAAAIAAVCKDCPATKAEVRDNGGMEALVRVLKEGEDKDIAVEEAACVMRCIISPPHSFWDEAMVSIYDKPGTSTDLKSCVTAFYRAEASVTLQHRALEKMLAEGPEKSARSKYVWALLQLVNDCDENRLELAELYATGIAPLRQQLLQMAAQQSASEATEHTISSRMQKLLTRYYRPKSSAS